MRQYNSTEPIEKFNSEYRPESRWWLGILLLLILMLCATLATIPFVYSNETNCLALGQEEGMVTRYRLDGHCYFLLPGTDDTWMQDTQYYEGR